jgi:asparagine synthase (glutamine-hydrolysing)
MCGIFFYYGIKYIKSTILLDSFYKISYRGPDDTVELYNIINNINFGFHRLSINGLDKESGQPLINNNIYCICNGEIYNYAILAKEFNITLKTNSDCEIIIHLYNILGFHAMVKRLEGVFSLVLYDAELNNTFIARDPVGIRPLFVGTIKNSSNEYIFASEAKCLYNELINLNSIIQCKPGAYYCINSAGDLSAPIKYINLYNKNYRLSYTDFQYELKKRIEHSIDVRSNISDRPVGALLSGGIDSSIVAMVSLSKLKKLRTFSIGLEGGGDLIPARMAAEAIGSFHTEVIFTIEEGLAAIDEIIRILETPDITTIRASLPMYLLSKYIKNNTDITVVLSGEGPDEVLGGYLYNHNAPNSFEFQNDAIMRIKELPYYDVLRSDRSTASNSLEVRVPLLCKNIVKLAMGSNPDY